MTNFDIFNGDADGLCALHQLRLAEPRDSILITGTKRDTLLLNRVQAQAGDRLTVLDIGLEQNRPGLLRALDAGASCLYFDHHFPGEIPSHPALETHIRTEPDVCTSLLVDQYLRGKYRRWAVCAAFGDGLHGVAMAHCRNMDVAEDDVSLLRELGEALNYNAYGETIEDLHFQPEVLFKMMRPYTDPVDFARRSPVFPVLREGFMQDLRLAAEQAAMLDTARHYAVALPDAPWARRINGVLASRLAQQHPARAHAVLVPRAGGFLVSVRAPIANPVGADRLCRRFESGGGRSGAAGINLLPTGSVAQFLTEFTTAFD